MTHMMIAFRLLMVLIGAVAMTGAVLVLQMLKIAHPGYAPAVFVTVLLLGLVLAVLGRE